MSKKLVSEGVSAEVIAEKLGKQYPAVYMKMRRLGLEVDVDRKFDSTTTSTTTGPSADLLTPEEALELLSDSMRKIGRGGLSKLELLEITNNHTLSGAETKLLIILNDPTCSLKQPVDFRSGRIFRLHNRNLPFKPFLRLLIPSLKHNIQCNQPFTRVSLIQKVLPKA